jgi:hypothetical protein
MPDVICLNCGQSWLEITESFAMDKVINADMFRLKKKYRDQGQSFCNAEVPTASAEGYDVTCPCCDDFMCDGNLKFNGRLHLTTPKRKYTCAICGRGWDIAGPYNGHMKGPCGKK